jgi:hypothetical protein
MRNATFPETSAKDAPMNEPDLRLLTENEARELTAQIYGHIDMAWTKIKSAYYGRADQALGYESWDDYCVAEFHGAALRLPRERRREAVATLSEAGLSVRAIAAATGAGRSTVGRDIAGVPNGTPGDTRGLDGKTYPPMPHAPIPRPPIVIDGTFVESPPPITATTTEPTCSAPTRPAIVDRLVELESIALELANDELTTGERALLLEVLERVISYLEKGTQHDQSKGPASGH